MSEELRIIVTVEDKASKPTADINKAVKTAGEEAQKSSGGVKELNAAFQDLTGINLTGVGAILAVGAALKYTLDQAFEGERAMAATEAVIRSTGGAAGMTAQNVNDLANEEKNLTGISDEVVQSGINMLLTFKNIGGDTMPRATRAMEDMAAAMAGGDISALDLKGTAISLGKALNDFDGFTILKRQGVTFSDEQERMIRLFKETNDVSGYQKLVLAELESEFSGMAEAMGETNQGKIVKFKNNIDDLAETIGSKLIPVLGEAAGGLNTLFSWNDRVTAATTKHRTEVLLTSKTYQEYVSEVERSEAGILGLLGERLRAQKLLTEEEYNRARGIQVLIDKQADYADGHDRVAAAEKRRASSESDAFEKSQELYEKHAKDVAKAKEDVLDYADKFDERMGELKDTHLGRQDEMYRSLDKLNDNYNGSVIESAEKLTDRLGELSDAHIERVEDNSRRLSAINKDYNERAEEDARQLNEKLAQMAESLADRQRSLNEQIADMGSDFSDRQLDRQERAQDDIDNLHESREKKRQELENALGDAVTHGASRRELEKALAALAIFDAETAAEEAKIRAKAAKEDARAQVEYDKKLMRLKTQLEREQAEYDKQVAKLNADAERQKAKAIADHAEKLAELQASLDKENTEYAKQTAKVNAEAEKQKEKSRIDHEERVSELSISIEKENVEYIKQTEKIEREYSKQREKLREHLAEVEEEYRKSMGKINIIIAPTIQPPPNAGNEPGRGGVSGLPVVGGGGSAGEPGRNSLTFVYSPMLNLSNEIEVQTKLVPILDRWYRGVNSRRM